MKAALEEEKRQVAMAAKSSKQPTDEEDMPTRLKNNKNVTRCSDSRSAKAGKQDSIKQFSTQLHPVHTLTWKDM